jgi:hypothetical protein
MSRARNSFFIKAPEPLVPCRINKFNPNKSNKKVECTVTSPDQYLEVMNRLVCIHLYDDGHFEVFKNEKNVTVRED